jgi:hypothetical protein
MDMGHDHRVNGHGAWHDRFGFRHHPGEGPEDHGRHHRPHRGEGDEGRRAAYNAGFRAGEADAENKENNESPFQEFAEAIGKALTQPWKLFG